MPSTTLDLTDAFKYILVAYKGLITSKLYMEGRATYVFLPFGLSSTLALFAEYTKALEYAMHANQITKILNYRDNSSPMAQQSLPQCQHNIDAMV